VRDADGSPCWRPAAWRFVTVIQSGIQTAANGANMVSPGPPVRSCEYENGRLAVEDPETGWSVELYAFGADNKAAFERLLARE
jgi:putative photosynthetic complex assembly protein